MAVVLHLDKPLSSMSEAEIFAFATNSLVGGALSAGGGFIVSEIWNHLTGAVSIDEMFENQLTLFRDILKEELEATRLAKCTASLNTTALNAY